MPEKRVRVSEVRDIPVHPFPLSDEAYWALRKAKQELKVDWKIRPVQPVDSSWARILAIGEKPMMVRDYLLVDPKNIEQLKAGILWATDHWMEHPAAHTVPDILNSIFKGKVREIAD